MVKIAFVLLSLAIAVSAAPQGPAQEPPQQQAVQILNQDTNISPNSYNFEFNTSDGTSRQEQGELENVGTDDEGIAIKGQYTYVAPDGQKYSVTYTADNNGFQPQIHLEPSNSA